MSCACQPPHTSINPRQRDMCLHCGKQIAEGTPWEITDATHNAFLDRVEMTFRVADGWPWDQPPPRHWQEFRRLALERERAGRERFGLDYLARDNVQAGIEEDIDGFNYLWFSQLQALRNGEDEEWDLALTAAYHDFKAHECRLRLQDKRRGATGPGWDE